MGWACASSHGCIRLYPEGHCRFLRPDPHRHQGDRGESAVFVRLAGGDALPAGVRRHGGRLARTGIKNRKASAGAPVEPENSRRRFRRRTTPIDWQRVGDLAHAPRALAVPITGGQDGVDSVVSQSSARGEYAPSGLQLGWQDRIVGGRENIQRSGRRAVEGAAHHPVLACRSLTKRVPCFVCVSRASCSPARSARRLRPSRPAISRPSNRALTTIHSPIPINSGWTRLETGSARRFHQQGVVWGGWPGHQALGPGRDRIGAGYAGSRHHRRHGKSSGRTGRHREDRDHLGESPVSPRAQRPHSWAGPGDRTGAVEARHGVSFASNIRPRPMPRVCSGSPPSRPAAHKPFMYTESEGHRRAQLDSAAGYARRTGDL